MTFHGHISEKQEARRLQRCHRQSCPQKRDLMPDTKSIMLLGTMIQQQKRQQSSLKGSGYPKTKQKNNKILLLNNNQSKISTVTLASTEVRDRGIESEQQNQSPSPTDFYLTLSQADVKLDILPPSLKHHGKAIFSGK